MDVRDEERDLQKWLALQQSSHDAALRRRGLSVASAAKLRGSLVGIRASLRNLAARGGGPASVLCTQLITCSLADSKAQASAVRCVKAQASHGSRPLRMISMPRTILPELDARVMALFNIGLRFNAQVPVDARNRVHDHTRLLSAQPRRAARSWTERPDCHHHTRTPATNRCSLTGSPSARRRSAVPANARSQTYPI